MEANQIADALEAEYLAVANGMMKPSKIDLESMAHAVQELRRLAAIPSDAAQAPVDWRELSRRLYVELFHCDQQMRSTRDEEGEPHWTQSAVVRDVLRDAKEALAAAPIVSQAGGGAAQAPSELRGAIEEVADYLEESANLSIVSQFTAISEWIDSHTAPRDFDAWARAQTWADKYDMGVARIGWNAALAAPVAPAAAEMPDENSDEFRAACSMALKASDAGVGPCGVFIAGYRALRGIPVDVGAPAAAAPQQPYALRFPTMLRKMWSGSEVQAWLDELPPLYEVPTHAGDSNDDYASLIGGTAPVEPVQSTPAAAQPDERAAFEWPPLPEFPAHHYSTMAGSLLFTEHQMQGYANAYGETIRATASQATVKGDGSGEALPAFDATVERAAVPQAGATLTDEQRADLQKVIDCLEPDDWCGDESIMAVLNRVLAAHPSDQGNRTPIDGDRNAQGN